MNAMQANMPTSDVALRKSMKQPPKSPCGDAQRHFETARLYTTNPSADATAAYKLPRSARPMKTEAGDSRTTLSVISLTRP
ncbi:MAG: hypothetical protein JNM58_12055 [Xanthomonadaceae bacterium]|nr:hypothetical protein [Xanthomonadaceae bacterium]